MFIQALVLELALCVTLHLRTWLEQTIGKHYPSFVPLWDYKFQHFYVIIHDYRMILPVLVQELSESSSPAPSCVVPIPHQPPWTLPLTSSSLNSYKSKYIQLLFFFNGKTIRKMLLEIISRRWQHKFFIFMFYSEFSLKELGGKWHKLSNLVVILQLKKFCARVFSFWKTQS